MINGPLNRFFIVHTDVFDAVGKALRIARAADQSFNAGSWLTPVSITVPDDRVEADIVRELLVHEGLNYHESPWDI